MLERIIETVLPYVIGILGIRQGTVLCLVYIL